MNTPIRIFLIEDDVDELCFYQDALKEKASTIDLSFFQNSEGVMAFLDTLMQHELPDVIISDLNMPKLNGYELLVQLKSSEKYGKIPIFICSSSANPADKHKCLQAGATEYIVKPLRLSFYSELLESIINYYTEKHR